MEEKKITIERDGAIWCAFRDGFQNVHGSDAGFGISPLDALVDLYSVEGRLVGPYLMDLAKATIAIESLHRRLRATV